MKSTSHIKQKVFLIGLGGIIVLLLAGCEPKEKQQMIEQNFLQNSLNIGVIFRPSSIAKESNGVVCVVYPYQPYVAESVPQSSRINAHLKEIGYTPDESHWAILVVDSQAVHLSKFKRSAKLDILAAHEIQAEHKAKFPKGFEPRDYAPLQKSALIKIESQGRIFLIIGEIK